MGQNTKSKLGEYWEKNILSWEESAYYKDNDQKEHLLLWDRLSTWFRGATLYERRNATIDFLTPHLRDLIVLDVGCGSGRFAFQLLQAGATRVIGCDISDSAVNEANNRREDSEYKDKLEFFRTDVTQPDIQLPEVDLTTALGVVEYFDLNSLAVFISNLKTQYFFFSFPWVGKRKGLLTEAKWLLRKIYLIAKRCPGVYSYSLEEFSDITARGGFTNVSLLNRSDHYFITNIPKL